MPDDTREPSRHGEPAQSGRVATVLSSSPIDISRDGRHARERGDPRSINPHPEGSQEHVVWERGYAMPDDEASPG